MWNDDRIYVNIGRLDFILQDSKGEQYYCEDFEGIVNWDTFNRVNLLYVGESGYSADRYCVPESAIGLKVYYNLGTFSSPNWAYWPLNLDYCQDSEEGEEEEEFDASSHLSIIDSNAYTSDDYTYVFGIVKNIGSTNLRFVKLSCTLYDKSDGVIEKDETYT